MMCQCSFTDCKKCPTLVCVWGGGGHIYNGGDYACVREGGTWEISVSPVQYCCESKTTLKNTVYFLKRYRNILLILEKLEQKTRERPEM